MQFPDCRKIFKLGETTFIATAPNKTMALSTQSGSLEHYKYPGLIENDLTVYINKNL